MKIKFPALVERCADTGLFTAIMPAIPGAHTQAAGKEELLANLKEVAELALAEMAQSDASAMCGEFVGVEFLELEIPDPVPGTTTP